MGLRTQGRTAVKHTCTKHAPGRACYHHGCRCRDCTDAATRYAKHMKLGH